MFRPDDIVVYHHRVCRVAAVRAAYFEGRDYLELHALFERTLKLFVAADDAEASGVRPVMTRDEALALIDTIPTTEPIEESDIVPQSATATLAERRMKEEYDRRLKLNGPEALIPILRSAYVHGEERKARGRQMTATDKKYFDLAESLLCDELSIALDVDRADVRDVMIARIHRADEEHGRPPIQRVR